LNLFTLPNPFDLSSSLLYLIPVTKEQQYQLFGWIILSACVLVALIWCLNEAGLTGVLIRSGQRYLDVKLVQISWLITILALGLPGLALKRYFEGLAWKEHLRNMPAPDIRESARRSKYIKVEDAPPAPPKPVEVSAIPEHQEEFIATCVACGHFFSARKSGETITCPQCGEIIPINS
jgi:hypothetical protein